MDKKIWKRKTAAKSILYLDGEKTPKIKKKIISKKHSALRRINKMYVYKNYDFQILKRIHIYNCMVIIMLIISYIHYFYRVFIDVLINS